MYQLRTGEMMAIVLGGGKGSRLHVLTELARRPKPAVPFGGKYRIIDFVLNSIINSGIPHTLILTQYYGNAIERHIRGFGFNHPMSGMYVEALGPQQHEGHGWYTGTANAVFQNRRYLEEDPAEVVAILAADHIYKIDLQQMLAFHRESGSDFTIAGFTVATQEASRFGVMEVDEHSRVRTFKEKPDQPAEIPGQAGSSLISMGVYLVNKRFLLECLERDHWDTDSTHDFGSDIIPAILADQARVFCWQFATSRVPGEDADAPAYWRDVGTPESYMEAQMDLVAPRPQLNLYNERWPLRTAPDFLPPAKDVFPRDSKWARERDGFGHCAMNRIASGGCIFDSPGRMDQVVIGRRVLTEHSVDLDRVVCFDGVRIGAEAQIRWTIMERGVVIPAGARIGYDLEEDIEHGVMIGVSKKDWKSGAFRERDHDRLVRVVTKDHRLTA